MNMNPASLNGSESQLITLLLIFLRCSTLLAIAPIFSARQMPMLLRFAFGLLLSVVIAPLVPSVTLHGGVAELATATIAQISIGAIMGFWVGLIFAGIEFAGEILDTQVGFGVVNIINPLTDTNVSVLGQLEVALTTLLFLSTDAHHLVLHGLVQSFDIAPLPFWNVQTALLHGTMHFFALTLGVVFTIAAPVSLALLMTTIALALLARVAPQMNVFVLGLPAQLGIGLFLFGVTMPLLVYQLPKLFMQMPRYLPLLGLLHSVH